MSRIATATGVLAVAAAAVAAVGACSSGRTADAYRADTQQLLAIHKAPVKQCYDTARAGDAAVDQVVAGTVAIAFTVEHDTGAVVDVHVDPTRTTAPAALGRCVVEAVRGLRLDPPDRRDGHATFVYEFRLPAAS